MGRMGVWTEAHVMAAMCRKEPSPPPPAQETPEGTLLEQVRALAKRYGWESYHTHDSRKSEPGFPDLVLIRAATATSRGRLVFAELKSEKGKLTHEQETWLDILRHTIPHVEVYLWRPSDFSNIVELLLEK